MTTVRQYSTRPYQKGVCPICHRHDVYINHMFSVHNVGITKNFSCYSATDKNTRVRWSCWSCKRCKIVGARKAIFTSPWSAASHLIDVHWSAVSTDTRSYVLTPSVMNKGKLPPKYNPNGPTETVRSFTGELGQFLAALVQENRQLRDDLTAANTLLDDYATNFNAFMFHVVQDEELAARTPHTATPLDSETMEAFNNWKGQKE